METPEQKKYNMEQWSDRRIIEEHDAYDPRSEYEHDRGRIIHAPCFRRLQTKSQVLDVVEGDYHRTRLTHTLEVSQIARGIVQRLRKDNENVHSALVEEELVPDYNLIEAIAYAHDLGHPPFGHNGEVALNYMMRRWGGFEGNAQSLRLVTKLEGRLQDVQHHPEEELLKTDGLNLTRRVLLGILKYPRPFSEARRFKIARSARDPKLLNQEDWAPPKCYYDSERDVVDWLQKPLLSDWATFISWEKYPQPYKHGKPKYKSIDCSIMELADDIAYVTHDIEDGVTLGFITLKDWNSAFSEQDATGEDRATVIAAKNAWSEWVNSDKGTTTPSLDSVRNLLFADTGAERRHAISALIGVMMHSVTLERDDSFHSELLAWNAALPEGMGKLRDRLWSLVQNKVIESAEVQTLEYRGRFMIMQMFEAIMSDPKQLLPTKHRDRYKRALSGDETPERIICDFISSMTDPYARRYYDRLFTPGRGSSFDKL